MKCRKCGTECPDGNVFCEACGAELDTPVLPENIDEKGRFRKNKTKPAPRKSAAKKAPSKKDRTPEEREKLLKRIKTVLAALAVVAVIVVIIVIMNALGSNKGFAAAQSIPIGRNVEFAESETGLDFVQKSSNGLINSMSDFDYICVSDDTVKVNGSEQPQWVIMLNLDAADRISEVEYYDFRQLKLNWKGHMTSEMLTKENLEFGMSMRNVSKTLGLKPYYVKRTVSNDSVYCYRYYFFDPVAGYDRVFNYYVEFSDIELAVRNVHYTEVDYARTILNAGESSVKAKEDITGDGEESEDSEEPFDDSEDSEDDYEDE